MQWKFIVSLFLAVFVTIFALQNSDPVSVRFFISTTEMSQALIIILSAVVGAIIALYLGLVKQLSLSKTIKEKDNKIRNLETDISELKVENKSLKPLEKDDI